MDSTRRMFLAQAAAAVPAVAASPGLELIEDGDFRNAPAGQLPRGWEIVSPNPVLAPRFEMRDAGGGRALAGCGNGRAECFGYVRRRVRLEGRRQYLFAVELAYEGLPDLNRHLVHGVFDPRYRFNEGITGYERLAGSAAKGEARFPGPAEPLEAEVRLYFRFSPQGTVYWRKVSLREAAPVAAKPVRIACREGGLPRGAGPAFWEKWLDEAGTRKADLALLPEMFNGKSPAQPEPLDGPTAAMMSRKARQWRMFVSGSFYEKRDDLVYNTAPLFDRTGRMLGTYEKNFPYEPELDEGVTPGTALPVFETELGRIAIMICYDSWFPEMARTLSRRGADLILFPNAGYFLDLMPARASDNSVWIAVSSLNHPAGVWDPGGARAGEAAPALTRDCPDTVLEWERNPQSGLVLATVDMSRKYSPAWHAGPMLSGPGGRRVRGTRMAGLETELVREASRWWL